VDNQVSSPPVATQPKSNSTEASTSANSNPTTSETKVKENENSAEEVHKPIVPFSNRLKKNKSNAQMQKILEMFNQVKLNVSLLYAIQ